MTKETLLMQYQSECLSALKSVANINVVLNVFSIKTKKGSKAKVE